MHRETEELETHQIASQRDGGIEQAFSVVVSANKKDLIGAMMYGLPKEKISLTKFSSLVNLSIQLGG